MDWEVGDYLADETFEKLSLAEQTLPELDLEGCTFRGCDLSGATWTGTKFLDCTFEDCDLSNIRLISCRIRDTRLLRCKAIGVDWSRAELVTGAHFEECKLDMGFFEGVDLSGGSLLRSSLREANLTRAVLRECDCRESDFLGARFDETDLSTADLRGAHGYAIHALKNRVKGARFSLPEAVALLEGLGVVLEDP